MVNNADTVSVHTMTVNCVHNIDEKKLYIKFVNAINVISSTIISLVVMKTPHFFNNDAVSVHTNEH